MAQTFPGTETAAFPGTDKDSAEKDNPSEFFPPLDDVVQNDENVPENLEDAIDAKVVEEEGKEEDSIGDLVDDEAKEESEEPLDTTENAPEEETDTEIVEKEAETKVVEAVAVEDEVIEDLTEEEKHGYTPSIFHCLFPIFGLAYH